MSILRLFAHDPSSPLLFNSGVFFLCFTIFLIGLLLVLDRRRLKLLYVLLFSLFYYYKCNGVFLSVLLVTTVLDFGIARQLAKTEKTGARKGWVALSVLTNLSILGYFKYTNFFLGSFAAAMGDSYTPLSIFLPIGISFYTFQSIAYVVDVYREELEPTESLLEYAFFLSFFPQIVAGPIVRAKTFFPQIRAPRSAIDPERMRSGMFLVLRGLAKKALIADFVGVYADLVFKQPTAYAAPEVWLGVYGYAVQIYFDFSGYSDMAVGMAKMVGFDLPENFRVPYRATNITNFWQRWHITLSQWLRDYLYIPLGGNRGGALRRYRNLMLTMLFGGLWHGASWSFVAWGGMHGVALCAHKLWRDRMGEPSSATLSRGLAWFGTFHFVAAAWIFFRAPTFASAGEVFAKLASGWPTAAELAVIVDVRADVIFAVGLGLLVSHVPPDWSPRFERRFVRAPFVARLALFLVFVQGAVQLASRDVQPFIYFQF